MKPLLALMAILFLSGCDKAKEAQLGDQILGKWKSTNHPSTWEFFKDGSCTGGHELRAWSGTWTTIDEKHIKIKWPDFFVVYEVTGLSTNRLELTTPNKVVWAFRKI